MNHILNGETKKKSPAINNKVDVIVMSRILKCWHSGQRFPKLGKRDLANLLSECTIVECVVTTAFHNIHNGSLKKHLELGKLCQVTSNRNGIILRKL